MTRLTEWQEATRADLETAQFQLAGYEKTLELFAQRIELINAQTDNYTHLTGPTTNEIKEMHERLSVARGRIATALDKLEDHWIRHTEAEHA